jgi:hypothetical protein
VPQWIGKLTELRDLSLCVNYFEGSLPESLGNLKNLVRFKAFENHAYTKHEVEAKGLKKCKIHSKRLMDGIDALRPREYKCPPYGISGTIPSSMKRLSKLQIFYMDEVMQIAYPVAKLIIRQIF